MTHEEDVLPSHICPFDHGHEEADQEAGTGPWKLYVTDRNGTYHSISDLRVVALNEVECEELEYVGESVLDNCEGLSLKALLQDQLDSYDHLEWE